MAVTTNIDLSKYYGMAAYKDLPRVPTATIAYLPTPGYAKSRAAECLHSSGESPDEAAAAAGIPVESVDRLLATGVTRLSDLIRFFAHYGLQITAVPAECAKVTS